MPKQDSATYKGTVFDPSKMRQPQQQQSAAPQPQQQQPPQQQPQQEEDLESWSRDRLMQTVMRFADKIQHMQEHQQKLLYAYRLNRDLTLTDEQQAEVSRTLDACEGEKALQDAYTQIMRDMSGDEEEETAPEPDSARVHELYERFYNSPPPPAPDALKDERRGALAGRVAEAADAYGDADEPADMLVALSDVVVTAYAAATEHGLPLRQGVDAAYESARPPDDDGGVLPYRTHLDARAVIEEHGFNFRSLDQYIDAVSEALAESALERADAVRAASRVIGTGTAEDAYREGVMPITMLEQEGVL